MYNYKTHGTLLKMGPCRSCKSFLKIIATITFIFFNVVTVNLEFYCTFTPVASSLCLGRRGLHAGHLAWEPSSEEC